VHLNSNMAMKADHMMLRTMYGLDDDWASASVKGGRGGRHHDDMLEALKAWAPSEDVPVTAKHARRQTALHGSRIQCRGER